MDSVLIIFVKNPVAGKVKTRLAQTVGDKKALQIYKKLLDYTLGISSEVDAAKQIWYSDEIPQENGVNRPVFGKKVQKGADLGERMKYAFQQVFAEGFHRAVIIGSDCAELTSDHLKKAYKRLKKWDLVIGPAEDGGYYLLGMKRFHPQLFENINWSTNRVLRQTLNRAEGLGLSPSLLPELNDVDYKEDWDSVKEKLR